MLFFLETPFLCTVLVPTPYPWLQHRQLCFKVTLSQTRHTSCITTYNLTWIMITAIVEVKSRKQLKFYCPLNWHKSPCIYLVTHKHHLPQLSTL
jgi:hypothetical protein